MTNEVYKEIQRIVEYNENQSGPIYFPYIPLYTSTSVGGNDGYYLIENCKVSEKEYKETYNIIKQELSLR